jgi:dihydrofolate synthase/folylpolyglutamate synthase
VKNTGIKGRWQKLSSKPLVIADAGHNFDGILQVVQQLKSMKYNNLHFIFGTVADKDTSKILRLLPDNAVYYFTKAKIPRALPADELKAIATNIGLNGNNFQNVESALNYAIENAKNDDLIFIGGSTFIVAEAIEFYEKNKKNH